MMYRILADLTVIVHFAYVSFVLFGLLLTMIGWAMKWNWIRNGWFRCVHLAMILIVVVEAWLGITCPLTDLENWLRAMAGQEAYRGDFIANWLHDAMFFEASPWVFTLAYSLFAAVVVATWIWIPPRLRKQRLAPLP